MQTPVWGLQLVSKKRICRRACVRSPEVLSADLNLAVDLTPAPGAILPQLPTVSFLFFLFCFKSEPRAGCNFVSRWINKR